MKSMIDVLSIVASIAALVFALYQFYLFATRRVDTGVYDPHSNTYHLWLAIAAAVIALICGLAFFVRRVNKEEEIHITQ